eukprot:7378504-Prymnesium_polylepis.1
MGLRRVDVCGSVTSRLTFWARLAPSLPLLVLMCSRRTCETRRAAKLWSIQANCARLSGYTSRDAARPKWAWLAFIRVREVPQFPHRSRCAKERRWTSRRAVTSKVALQRDTRRTGTEKTRRAHERTLWTRLVPRAVA